MRTGFKKQLSPVGLFYRDEGQPAIFSYRNIVLQHEAELGRVE
jgi:hypothetical protein